MKYTQYHRKSKQFKMSASTKLYYECVLEDYHKLFKQACVAKSNKDMNEMYVTNHQEVLKDAQEIIYLSPKNEPTLQLCLPRFVVENHSQKMKGMIKERRNESNTKTGDNEDDGTIDETTGKKKAVEKTDETKGKTVEKTSNQKNENPKISIEIGKPSDHIY